MEIAFNKRINKEGVKSHSERHEIIKFKTLTSNTSALLVFESETELEDKPNAPLLEIRPIQFIAACETDQRIQFIGAFYISEYCDLACQVISDIPSGYYRDKEAYVIDYKSYAEICKLTGEETLSFVEYVKVQRQAHSWDSTNSYIVVDDQWLNADQQAAQSV